ncbi:MAG: histidine--tRNA ligase [Candidatus Pacearchaeota archaeon]
MKIKELKGIKDYLPEEQILREKIIDILKEKFKIYGFKPIETSILDYYEIAASKYAGSEIIKEIYKLKDRGNRELCLRYELTFKLAKLIALNPNIRFPFKRYEIGKVFRDGPVKKGRLREFTQCDIDIIGIKSFVADAEIIALAFDIFKTLDISVFAYINSINILFGIFDYCEIDREKFNDIALSIDKIEKLGKNYVIEELRKKGIKEKNIKKIFEIFDSLENKNNEEKIDYLKNLKNDILNKGINEIEEVLKFLSYLGINKNIIFNPSLARGLSYYTSLIWEFYAKNKIKSSIAAGGRWDNLISKFLNTDKEYPATGMSFGLDVIYEILKEKYKDKLNIIKVLIIPINTLEKCLEISNILRKNKISCSIIYEKNLKKALDYANKEKIKYCLIIGEKEIKEGKLKLKDMESGEEKLLYLQEVIEKLK